MKSYSLLAPIGRQMAEKPGFWYPSERLPVILGDKFIGVNLRDPKGFCPSCLHLSARHRWLPGPEARTGRHAGQPALGSPGGNP